MLDRNPLENIRNTNSIRYVMKNGEIYEGDTLNMIWPRAEDAAEAVLVGHGAEGGAVPGNNQVDANEHNVPITSADKLSVVNVPLILVLAYTVGLTVFGVWIGRRVQGASDFFVAGRKLTWPLVGGTVLAANIGAGTTVGAAGLAYRDGISAWWWNGSAGLGTLVLAFWVGPRLWALASSRGYFTLGDYLEDRYSGTVRALSRCCSPSARWRSWPDS